MCVDMEIDQEMAQLERVIDELNNSKQAIVLLFPSTLNPSPRCPCRQTHPCHYNNNTASAARAKPNHVARKAEISLLLVHSLIRRKTRNNNAEKQPPYYYAPKTSAQEQRCEAQLIELCIF